MVNNGTIDLNYSNRKDLLCGSSFFLRLCRVRNNASQTELLYLSNETNIKKIHKESNSEELDLNMSHLFYIFYQTIKRKDNVP